MRNVANGDSRHLPLQSASVQCAILSPPYLGLRDYGTGEWEGGDETCQHRVGGQVNMTKDRGGNRDGIFDSGLRPGVDASRCVLCGAIRHDKQIGLEARPELYTAALAGVMAEVWRVLKPAGTVWINLGDSYGTGTTSWRRSGRRGTLSTGTQAAQDAVPRIGMTAKNLLGMPWRVALAMQGFAVLPARSVREWADTLAWAQAAGDWDLVEIVEQRLRYWDMTDALRDQGWTLRADVIWWKPNPMPESAGDRPTRAHEHIFLLSKSPRYKYYADRIREANSADMQRRAAAGHTRGPHGKVDAARNDAESLRGETAITANGRNKRDVWAADDELGEFVRWASEQGVSLSRLRDEYLRAHAEQETGDVWRVGVGSYSGAHFATFPPSLIEPMVRACTDEDDVVLDPFSGAGTVAWVCAQLRRKFVGCELNPDYVALGHARTAHVQQKAW